MTYLPAAALSGYARKTDLAPLATKVQLDQKANASTVGGLATAVNSKASKVAVEALSEVMDENRGRKATALVSESSFVWVYSEPFPPDVTPICFAIAQPMDGDDVFIVHLAGEPTNESCEFRIVRLTPGETPSNLTINPEPVIVQLHMLAFGGVER